MKIRLKVRTVLGIIALYAIAFGVVVSSNAAMLLLLSLYGGASIAFAAWAMSSEEAIARSGTSSFRKNYPLRRYGISVATFQHVYYHGADITPELMRELEAGIRARGAAEELRPVELTDVDGELLQAETRTFRLACAPATIRGTVVSIAVHTCARGELQSFQWWILLDGFRDPNKVAIFVATAPLTVPFWLVRFLRHEHEVAPQLRNVYSAFYNDLDAAFTSRGLYTIAFDALVAVLERNGIDTGDLKANRAQILNINVSGGRANIGNVIQGVANTVRQAARPKAAA